MISPGPQILKMPVALDHSWPLAVSTEEILKIKKVLGFRVKGSRCLRFRALGIRAYELDGDIYSTYQFVRFLYHARIVAGHPAPYFWSLGAVCPRA